MSAGSCTKKFNIVSIHHGWMQKHDFSVLDQKYLEVPLLIHTCRDHDDVQFSCFWSEIPFLGKFGPKNQNC